MQKGLRALIEAIAVCVTLGVIGMSATFAAEPESPNTTIRRSPPVRETSVPVKLSLRGTVPRVGEPVDVAPFGEFRTWENGRDVGVLWEEMRDIFKVVVEFAEDAPLPDPSSIKLQYWQSSWPYRRIPRDEVSGSGESGWINVGDWFKGKWVNADVDVEVGQAEYLPFTWPFGTAPAPASGDKKGPFDTLPADHWAYDALRTLFKSGLAKPPRGWDVESNRVMSRFDFARCLVLALPTLPDELPEKIVLADGAYYDKAAIVTVIKGTDKLVYEFRDELTAMGVNADVLKRSLADLMQPLIPVTEEVRRLRIKGVQAKRWSVKDAFALLLDRGRNRMWTFTFRPINARECVEIPEFDAKYRSTFKLRLLCAEKAPKITAFHAFTDSMWDKMTATIEWSGAGASAADWDGKAEIFNGRIERTERTERGGIVSFLYAKPAFVNSYDETVVTFRCKENSFSFAARDLAQGKRIFIRDYGVLVKKADDPITYTEMEEAYANAPKDIYRRVAEMPEQTLSNAWAAIPQKNRIYMPLCVEGGRQYFRLQPDGSVMHDKTWLVRVKSSDTPRADWSKNAITVKFGIPRDGKRGATIEGGYMPISETWWEFDGLRVTQKAFATTFAGKLPREGRVEGEEPQACMIRFTVANCGENARTLRLPFRVQLTERGDQAMWPPIAADESLYEPLSVKEGIVYSRTDKERARFFVDRGDVAKLIPRGKTVLCEMEMPARATRQFHVTIPFLTPRSPEEIEQLKSLRFDEQHKMIAAYWRKRTVEGCRITTPEPMLNSFYSANASHQLINTQNEVGRRDTAMANVGTGSYGVFANESIMMIVELDRRGYHDVAEKALESFVRYQGTVKLPGDYTSQDGVYTGAHGYDDGGYNQNQGWVLWGLAEHYRFTRDKVWLERVAPSIIKGCDWIIDQRKRSKTDECVGIRAIEYGLLPQGSLEDISDFRCWMSNNDFTYWGLENVGRALADVGHPDGARLLGEAAEYKKDITAAFTEATVRSPVVELRDGTFVPYTPSEVHRRGRSWGWISETLEGGIYFIRCGVIQPDSKWAEWIMRDYEDNRYLSNSYGYQVPFFERDWFSLGGFSQQPSLLCSPTPYIMGDQPKHYLRAYFNAFAAGYFPERAMLTEHPLPDLGNWRGGHFKTSDEANNTSWLRWMFIFDEEDALYLGKAIPRYWLADGKGAKIENAATHFGPMSMSVESHAAKGYMKMVIDPPTRNLPSKIYARFRHPEGKCMNRVTVNGKPWKDFDPEKEWVVLPGLREKTTILAFYD
ncbi:MAG: hypothetical protein Q7T82_21455 [Armatimonadota bacterium]|nr:hypothetical protein [Armatimonadota bacterium]